MKRIQRSAIVEHAAPALRALVEDVERYPEFLPWCLEARVLERAPGRMVARLTAGLKGLRQPFTTENTTGPDGSMQLRLVEGPFRRFAASWKVVPLGAQGSRVEFTLEYEFSTRALGKLLGPLFEHIADTMVDAFKRRADQLHGQAAG